MNKTYLEHKILARRTQPNLAYHNNFHVDQVRDTAFMLRRGTKYLRQRPSDTTCSYLP